MKCVVRLISFLVLILFFFGCKEESEILSSLQFNNNLTRQLSANVESNGNDKWVSMNEKSNPRLGQTVFSGDYLYALLESGVISRLHIPSGVWDEINSGNSGISYIAVDSKGKLYAGGSFYKNGAFSILTFENEKWSTIHVGDFQGYYSVFFSGLFIDSNDNAYLRLESCQMFEMCSSSLYRAFGSKWIPVLVKEDWRDVSRMIPQNGGGFYITDSSNVVKKWKGIVIKELFSFSNYEDKIYATAVDSENNLYVGGKFNKDGIVNILKWNGKNIEPMGLIDEPVTAILAAKDGTIYAAGYASLKKWDGKEWILVTSQNRMSWKLFEYSNGAIYSNEGFWNGSEWRSFSKGLTENLHNIITDSKGNVYAFYWIDEILFVDKWDNNKWVYFAKFENSMDNLTIDKNDNFYFIERSEIKKWDGEKIFTIPGTIDYAIQFLTFDSENNLYITGNFNKIDELDAKKIAKWDGVKWSALYKEGENSDLDSISIIYQIVFGGNNKMFVHGSFVENYYDYIDVIFQYDGVNWQNISPEMNVDIYDMITDQKGNLFVAGKLYAEDKSEMLILRWDGSKWQKIENKIEGDVYKLAFDLKGNLYAAGDFYIDECGETKCYNIAGWDGKSWFNLGDGLNGHALFIKVDKKGDLLIGGGFGNAGDKISPLIAKWKSSEMDNTIYEYEEENDKDNPADKDSELLNDTDSENSENDNEKIKSDEEIMSDSDKISNVLNDSDSIIIENNDENVKSEEEIGSDSSSTKSLKNKSSGCSVLSI